LEPLTEFESASDDLLLLAIGDVHLGTRPSSLPDDLDECGVDPRTLTPEAALRSAVGLAIERGVDAVLFAGDVVESSNARFEALRPLEAAVAQLLDAGIRVLGVAGNHDVEALPRLADMIEGFELIGRGGRWEKVLLEKDGRSAAEILGWSFPERHVRTSPVLDLVRNPLPSHAAAIPRLGLLHGDLDASGGVYAPFTTAQLREAGLDAWLLGHIHKPSLRRDGAAGPLGYLGSLVGLDPGEQGGHGPWLVRVRRDGVVSAQHLQVAPLRWELVECEIGPDDDPEAVGDQVINAAASFARELQDQGPASHVLGVRIRLTGQTHHYEALQRAIRDGQWRHTNRRVGETLVFVDKVIDGLALAHDLAELSQGDTPLAILARKLLVLEQPGDDRNALLEAARAHTQALAQDSRWSALAEERDEPDPLSDDVLVDRLIRAGTAALSELDAQLQEQRDAADGAGQ
jgi:exonuclease SbcD